MPMVSAPLTRTREGLGEWIGQWGPTAGLRLQVTEIERAASGWSSETLLLSVDRPFELGDEGPVRELVFRIAPATEFASFPEVRLDVQAAVMRSVARAGLPVPRVVWVEEDRSWVGAPFLVMLRAPGRTVGDSPGTDEWLVSLSEPAQGALHGAFIDAVAAIDSIDARAAGLDGVLRAAGAGLSAETSWWVDYVDWAAGGDPAPSLAGQVRWCRDTAPRSEDAATLCWGDARLGNVMLDGEGSITALLDWELASIGPAELDLAWYLALDRLTVKVTGAPVPGFLSREQVTQRYEERIGRKVQNLRWHEIFALVRSAAINDRQARIATARGFEYPGVPGEENPLLAYTARRIDRYERGEA